MKTTTALLAALWLTGLAHGADPPAMRFAVLDREVLDAARQYEASGQPYLGALVARLRQEADGALKAGPFTITDKTVLPPSGDKHDYMSISYYAWPNPDTPDGLPYLIHDGKRSPDVNKFDAPRLGGMAGCVESLALGYWFTRDEAYARHAAELLRVFFLDPATRMNPSLNFAQGVPGVNKGECYGIIDTVPLAQRVVDAVAILNRSKSWTAADQRGLEAWFARYTHWLQHSIFGRHESRTYNNHASWYDAQVSAYAILCGRPSLARNVIATSTRKRMLAQIMANGSQPWELLRTKSWGYSMYNLEALFEVASIGDKVGVDLWHFAGSDGRGLKKALDFLVPYADPASAWPHKQILPRGQADLLFLLGVAARVYDDPIYAQLMAKMMQLPPTYHVGNREVLSVTDYLLATSPPGGVAP